MVLSDADKVDMLHSHRAFASTNSDIEANLESLLWAIESMKSLRVSKVIFAAEAKDMIGAVTRSPTWSSFKFHFGVDGIHP